MSQNYKVVVTDQVFLSIDTETQRLAAIGARIEVADGTPEDVARLGGDADALLNTYLPDLLSRCDVVSLHAPLTARARGMIGAAELATMRPGAILINTARGGLVDVDAVIEALWAERIGAAALDVLDTEPPAAGRLPSDLRSLLVTPHMAYYSEESIAESQRKAAIQIIKVLTGGRPDYPVRPRSPAAPPTRKDGSA